MRDGFVEWNRTVAAAMEAIGSAAFPRRLGECLDAVARYDILMVFAYRDGGRPVCLHHNIDPARAAVVIDDYAKGPYLLDPFYSAATGGSRTGVIRLKDLAPDLFYGTEYFKRHYARTDIRDEVGFLVRPTPAIAVVVSVTRAMTESTFSTRDMRMLRAAEPVILGLVARHWRTLAPNPAPQTDRNGYTPMEAALEDMAGGVLTAREVEITALILRGHSNASISDRLQIAEGTVKIHRKHIYQKLQAKGQADLFSRFIGHLASARPETA